MVFGRLGEALAAARALHRRHDRVRGRLPDSGAAAPYAANDRAALLWVHASLVDTALLAYRLVRPLSQDEASGYYAESRRFALFFGLGGAALPADFAGFSAYFGAMTAGGTLTVGEEAKQIATRLLAGGDRRITVPLWYRALTADLLPAPLAAAYGLPQGVRERRRARRAVALIRQLYRWLPPRLRYVGPYHEACERLRGAAPTRLTRIANRCWIGRPSIAGGAARK
jgi:uncharacterized protein (DUF2236 family)